MIGLGLGLGFNAHISAWILAGGIWNDVGVWKDESAWEDS